METAPATELSVYDVSPDALSRLKRSADVRRSMADTVRACVEIGFLVAKEQDDKCTFYGGSNPLPIGDPRQLVYWPDAKGEIRCQTFLETRQKLSQLATKFGIDENSAMNWCIDCLDRFDEAYDDRLRIKSVSKYGGYLEFKLQGRSRRRRNWNVT